jgi:hypothetical protein
MNLLVSGRERADRAVDAELAVVLHEKAVGYSIVPKYLCSVHFGERDAVRADSDDASDADLVDPVFLQALVFQSFLSAREISRMILPSKSRGYRHLSQSLGFVSQGLRWVPCRLSKIEKEARVEKSQEISQLVLPMKHQSWIYVVILDETRFSLCSDSETIRSAAGEPRPDLKRLSESNVNMCFSPERAGM